MTVIQKYKVFGLFFVLGLFSIIIAYAMMT